MRKRISNHHFKQRYQTCQRTQFLSAFKDRYKRRATEPAGRVISNRFS
jgi:hypothetical protein